MSAPDMPQIVTVQRDGEMVDVEGRMVTPGLAVTPTTKDDRFSITHIPSGLALVTQRCAEHIETAAQMAVAAGIDWTRDKDALVADVAVKDLAQNIFNATGYCYTKCDPLREGPSWSVRCQTCDWEWEDEHNEGPLDVKAAKRMARDHECEPDVQLSPPNDNNEWFAEWLVNEDGTVGAKVGAR